MSFHVVLIRPLISAALHIEVTDVGLRNIIKGNMRQLKYGELVN